LKLKGKAAVDGEGKGKRRAATGCGGAGARAGASLTSLQKYTTAEDRFAKLVPNRIFSLAIHPSETTTLVLAGDKWGCVGVWDQGQQQSAADEAVVRVSCWDATLHSRSIGGQNVVWLEASGHECGPVACLSGPYTMDSSINLRLCHECGPAACLSGGTFLTILAVDIAATPCLTMNSVTTLMASHTAEGRV
jgi:hypothetical protein